jgi:hypothetical protein
MFEKKTGQVLDVETGRVLDEIEDVEELQPVRILARGEDSHQQLDFAEPVDRDSLPEDIRSFFEAETKHREIVGGIEAVLKPGYAVLYYHASGKQSVPGEALLESRMAVYDRLEQRRIFSEVLERNARAPVPDAFFVKNSSLFFIKNQQTLCMLPLPGIPESSAS